MIVWTLDTILVVLIASALALVVRAYDMPATELTDKRKTAIGYIASIVAVIVSAYLADSLGIVLATWQGLVILAGAGVGGMVFIRAILQEKAQV